MSKPNRKIIQDLAKDLDITRFLDYRHYLASLFEKCKESISPYSYLDFAYDLSFSKSNVIRLIVIGERVLTQKAAAKIARALLLKGDYRRYFTALVQYQSARLPKERDRLFAKLVSYRKKTDSKDLEPYLVEYYSNWYNPIIREMAGLSDFNGDPAWIQKRLSFSLNLQEVRRSLELLCEIGIVKFNSETNRYERSNDIITDFEARGMAIILYHQKMIEMAKESITTVAPEKREIRAVTVALPESAVDILKSKIYEWSMEVMSLEERMKSPQEVYQVNFQMFPFTKKTAKKSVKKDSDD